MADFTLWPKDGLWPATKRVIKIVYTAALMLTFAYCAYTFRDINLSIWKDTLSSVSTLAIVALGAAVYMSTMSPLAEWFMKRPERFWHLKLWGRNINFIPLDYILLRVPFLVLLYLNLPVFAYIEEVIFRDGLGQWPQVTLWDALWRSFAFGLVHVLGGVRPGTVIPLTVGGLWFSWLYWYGGLPMATSGHLMCNTVVLTCALWTWARTGVNPFVD